MPCYISGPSHSVWSAFFRDFPLFLAQKAGARQFTETKDKILFCDFFNEVDNDKSDLSYTFFIPNSWRLQEFHTSFLTHNIPLIHISFTYSNGIWMKFFEIPPCAKKVICITEFVFLDLNSHEVNQEVWKGPCAWKNFKNIFSRPLFTIICRSKMLILKSVHFKNTVMRSSFHSKLWPFSIMHQLTSKQSQLMYYWKW